VVSAANRLGRHPAGRALLAAARRVRDLWRSSSAVRRRLRGAALRGVLALGGLAARPRLASRRAHLRRALAGLPPLGATPLGDREIFTIGTGDPGVIAHAVDADDRDLVCFRAPSTEALGDGWLDRLVAAMGDDTVAATPMLVHPARPLARATPDDLLVRALGLDLVLDAEVPVLRARAHGTRPDPRAAPASVDAAPPACVVVRRRAYVEVGGLAALPDVDSAIVELCWRLRSAGTIVAVPSSVVADGAPVRSPSMLTSPIDPSGPGWRAVVDLHGASMRRAASAGDALHVALTVAAPSAKVAPRWGDWHLAHALARALRRVGVTARVQTADHADDLAVRACDVHLVLRGVARVRRTPGQRHVLWVISHPEDVDPAECDDADLVLVASERYAVELRARTATPVEVLLQATDHHVFRPVPPDPRHAHDVVVVAKTRDVLRPVVADAIAAGLRPAIYGSGWERFVDPALVVAPYVDNERLPVVYSSAGVLLNDHWASMRANGFVSNRIFDALACATPVVSDDLPEIAALFDDAVATYRSPSELRALVDAALADPAASRERAARGRAIVLSAHTFDHRAAQLVDVLARHGLDQPPP
jgi:hypothetical protein